jgi:hypothetical protein
MVNKLLGQGIDVRQAGRDFTHEGRVYGAGTFVVSMAQPKMGVIRWLLGRTFYPDNSYTRNRDGTPISPYDMSTDNMAEFMGVRVDPVDEAVETGLTRVTALIEPTGQVSLGRFGYVLDGRLNDSFEAVNLLLAANVSVRRVDRPADGSLRPGDFLVDAGAPSETVADVARETGVDFTALDSQATAGSRPLTQLRIGMYQRYYGGNMDEGWTRWLLEDFSFPYTTLMDDAITDGDLNDDYDVIILPADGVAQMTGERRGGDGPGDPAPTYPEEYRSGFGQEGVDALEAFVENGGTLVTFAQAGALPIEKFGLPVRNVREGLSSTEFWSPGSTLRVNIDNTHPLAYGMPEQGLATFLGNNQVYQIVATPRNERADRIVTFVDRDVLQSGWLLGEDVITNKAAMVSVQHGQGRVVLIGFRAQHRAQTHGTFKLLFNTLMGGAGARADLALDGG